LGVVDADPRARIRAVRHRLAADGPPSARTGSADFARISVPQRDCDLLRDLLIAEQVGAVVEVGLAYAASALAIGEALISAGASSPQHVAIDPFQDTAWSDAGWQLLCAAGLDPIVRLMRQPSSLALPELLAEGFVADAAFVDGSHRFHEVFVDLYFLRKIVRPGGVIVMDDNHWPSVRTAAHYFELNTGWEAIRGAFDGGTVDGATGEPRVRAFRLPDAVIEPAFEQFRPFHHPGAN
jgi:predicted O-methyltransferase YrrM